ncbi:MAG TPA: metallophosphoesterase [Steroidobacteraceae bacterium]|nr:metallophosphoesterase [Steroidobacteraceae bacterium]
MKLLQITDPHLYGRADGRLRGVETDSSLRYVLDRALAEFPDYAALLVTGDLAQEDAGGYLRFRSICQNLQAPVLCIPGNHDEPAAMARELNSAPFQLCGARSIGAWRFVMLDSCAAGEVGGRISAAELDRLDAELAGSAAHTMVCLHHHPVAMGSRWLDSIGLANAGDFWRIIDAHAHVRGVAWGHVHQAFDGRRGGVRLFATPSTGAQFLPASDGFAVDTRPPAYRHFELHPDGRIESQVHWLEAMPAQQAAAR